MLDNRSAAEVVPSHVLPSLQDKITAFQKFATMYINYALIFRKLEECYDQVVHPQKRRLIRHILDGTMGRCVCVL